MSIIDYLKQKHCHIKNYCDLKNLIVIMKKEEKNNVSYFSIVNSLFVVCCLSKSCIKNSLEYNLDIEMSVIENGVQLYTFYFGNEI